MRVRSDFTEKLFNFKGNAAKLTQVNVFQELSLSCLRDVLNTTVPIVGI